MNFETELKKGNLVISECNKCEKIVWPPSEFCNRCLKENSWRDCSRTGKIIEFSKKENTYFCVVEIENSIKIIGEVISGIPDIGKQANITKCGIINDNYFFKMNVLD